MQPANIALHHDVMDSSILIKHGYLLPMEQSDLGPRLNDEIRRPYLFVSGSGEFNSVLGEVLKG